MGFFNKKELAEIKTLKTEIVALKGKFTKLVEENNGLKMQLSNFPKELYEIRRNKIGSFYCAKSSFFSPPELDFFETLTQTIIEKEFETGKYFIFSKVKLADIVDRWQGTWEKFKDNSYNKDIVSTIEKCYPIMDEDKYKKLILRPILELHVDFLVCMKIDGICVPSVIIELDDKDKEKDYNYNLKSAILNNVGFDKYGNPIKKYRPIFERIKNDEIKNSNFRVQLKQNLLKWLGESEKCFIKNIKNKSTTATATITTADPTQTENESRNNS